MKFSYDPVKARSVQAWKLAREVSYLMAHVCFGTVLYSAPPLKQRDRQLLRWRWETKGKQSPAAGRGTGCDLRLPCTCPASTSARTLRYRSKSNEWGGRVSFASPSLVKLAASDPRGFKALPSSRERPAGRIEAPPLNTTVQSGYFWKTQNHPPCPVLK